VIPFEKAIKLITDNINKLTTEYVPIEESVGRVIAEDIYSKIDMPPFNKSAVDGYAVIASDIKEMRKASLKNIGLIQAGESFRKTIEGGSGECVKIMTGAPLPKNTDSVVMVEDTLELPGGYVEILKKPRVGENVCFKGEDIKKGQKVLKKGKIINASDTGLLATVGRNLVRVSEKPRVAIINTGGEIVPAGKNLKKNKIYNANGPMLISLLKSDGIEPVFLGIARDKTEELKEIIRKGLEYNVLLISGGVSAGEYDLIPVILKELKVKEIFHCVKIKPGRPLYFGKKGKTVVFGIPGNPVSNFISYIVFVRLAIYRMMGYEQTAYDFFEGIIENEFHQKPGRKHFVPVNISMKGGIFTLKTVPNHGSADVMALSKSDGFMVVDEKLKTVRKNSKINFITWKKLQ